MSNLIEKSSDLPVEDASKVEKLASSGGAKELDAAGSKSPKASDQGLPDSVSADSSDQPQTQPDASIETPTASKVTRGIGLEGPSSPEKKQAKGGSLVERAALLSGTNPFSRPVGRVGDTPRRDPSSMNPIATPPPSPSFRGIGGPGGPKKKDIEADGSKDNSGVPSKVTTPAFSPVTASANRPSALERIAEANIKSEASLVQKKERKSKPPQEIDLVALREAGYITPDMPPNLMSEEFRIIKRSLLLHAFSKGRARSKNSNVLLVTSSNPSEGKTFCTINLALSIATEQDITVLLVDADFSKPEILNRLGVNGGRGLMDVVADDSIDVGECLIRTNIPNLVLLPAGRQHNLTTELLASERMETMVEEIATRYPDRLVIFDSPPVLASSAASVLALYMGQIVFVIEAEQTTEPQIKESLSMISACENINLLLNKTRYNGSNQKFASYYGYGGR